MECRRRGPGRPVGVCGGPALPEAILPGKRQAKIDQRDMRGRLVEAARALITAGGLDALSMRKVAADVGVAPTAIYWHVGDRDELLREVFEAMIAELPPLVPAGDTAKERVASLAGGLRRQILETASLQQLGRYLGRSAQLFLPSQVALARELSAAGLRGEAAADALRSVLFLVGGFILLEDEQRTRKPGVTSQELWEAVADPGIDEGLRRAMSRVAPSDALFAFALDRLLTSLLPPAPGS